MEPQHILSQVPSPGRAPDISDVSSDVSDVSIDGRDSGDSGRDGDRKVVKELPSQVSETVVDRHTDLVPPEQQPEKRSPEPTPPTDFLNVLRHPIFAIDRNLQIIHANEHGNAFIQNKFAKIEEKKCYEIIYNRKTPCAYCPVSELKANQDVNKIITFQGKTLQISFHTDAEQPWQFLIEEFRDITKEREERENEIRIFNLASIGTLISGVAHELNNPLTGLNLNLQNLIATLDTSNISRIRQRLQLMQEDVHRSMKISADILSITSPHRARFLTTNFRQTLLRAIDTVRRLYPEHSRRIQWKLEGYPVQFACQTEKIERLFVNLFHNSLQKYDYCQGVISVKWNVIDGKVCRITVQDQAGGIDTDTLKKLFQPFQRPSSNKQGSGLGLTVCLRIVQEHSGKINVKSQGEETTFNIELPMNLS